MDVQDAMAFKEVPGILRVSIQRNVDSAFMVSGNRMVIPNGYSGTEHLKATIPKMRLEKGKSMLKGIKDS